MKRKKNEPKSIFITGASSGLGAHLALEYAADRRTLHLSGRNEERLNKVAAECLEKGAKVFTYLFDTTDETAAKEALEKADARAPIDLLIANAGVSAGVIGDHETGEATRRIMNTNIFGTLNMILPALELMKKRKKGHIALIASLAGYRGMASCPAYSASKSAVKALGEALYGQQKPNGICITTVCPGFIETPLTDKNRFKMPFLMKPTKAARIIHKHLNKRPATIGFPAIMVFAAWFGSCLPAWIALPIFARFPKKEK